jgi:hypothetical protein
VRTLISTIIPPGATHSNAIISVCFLDEADCIVFSGGSFSIVSDFIVRIIGKQNINHDVISSIPIISSSPSSAVGHRALRLVSVTNHYAPLWERHFSPGMHEEAWAYSDSRLVHEQELPWVDLSVTWERGSALRSDFARRQALLEIDVLTAQALKLTLEELLTIYRVQFAVMRQYENADEYDAKGGRLPNIVRKDPGAKELREARKTHDGVSAVTVAWKVDNGLATVTKTFHPPFTKVHREDDYRRAWDSFAARFGAH